MYRLPDNDPPIRHLFRGGSPADKNTAETDYERENAHLHILHARFRQYGTRVTGHPRTPIPAPVPGARPAARKTSFSGSCLEGPSSAVLETAVPSGAVLETAAILWPTAHCLVVPSWAAGMVLLQCPPGLWVVGPSWPAGLGPPWAAAMGVVGSPWAAVTVPPWAAAMGVVGSPWAAVTVPPWAAAMGVVGSSWAAVTGPPWAAAMGVVGSSWAAVTGPPWAAGLLPDFSALLPLPSLVGSLWPFPPFGAVAVDGGWLVSWGDIEPGLLRRPFRLLLLFPGGGPPVPLLLGEDPDMRAGGLQYPCTLVKGAAGLVVAEVLFLPRREGGGGLRVRKEVSSSEKDFLGTMESGRYSGNGSGGRGCGCR
ncbi:hypothetical protein NDU88_003322 [Pleurodeles waltl]|uniref:Uncharacterized protein n=1 Tax=Pleurodeles waltl TaxID=8319 RepID=A0AAV7NHS4_PLEWA|nr:hypothetical protein NDU88_003322 [Pleurodeles waltl]